MKFIQHNSIKFEYIEIHLVNMYQKGQMVSVWCVFTSKANRLQWRSRIYDTEYHIMFFFLSYLVACCCHILSMFTPLGSSFMQLDGENQCLKAAQDCGLYEKCGALRSEYVLACTKPMPNTSRCNQYKCHRALRRFLERVPEEYSLGVLFCPCTNTLCGERRRKTIVPSCSYQDAESLQPNCLHQQSFCRRDDLCRLDLRLTKW